jgi:hypothetical protein
MILHNFPYCSIWALNVWLPWPCTFQPPRFFPKVQHHWGSPLAPHSHMSCCLQERLDPVTSHTPSSALEVLPQPLQL